MTSLKIKLLAISFVLLASSAWAERPWPDVVFDCQVKTVSGARGLVSIQAFSLEEAQREVVQRPALTTVGSREVSVSVTECIESGESKFTDTSFQYWRDRLEG